MTCNCQTILTTAVAVTDNQLVLTIPAGTYDNCANYVVRIAQNIPTTATNLMPVVVQIGTDAATLYAVNRRCGHRLYANQVRTRRNYVLKVAADTLTFVLVSGCIVGNNCGVVASLPVVTEVAAANEETE